MKNTYWPRALFISALLCQPAFGSEDEEIRELLVLNGTKAILRSQTAQIEESVISAINMSLKDRIPEQERNQSLVEIDSRIKATIEEALSWDHIEPKLIEHYTKAFTQTEISQMLAYSKSDAGRASAAKMPTVSAQTSQDFSTMLNAISGKFSEIIRSVLENSVSGRKP